MNHKRTSRARLLNGLIALMALLYFGIAPILLLNGVLTLPWLIYMSAGFIFMMLGLIAYRLKISYEGYLRQTVNNEFHQYEALIDLQDVVRSTSISGMRWWSMSPDLLAPICQSILRNRPGVILELGAGVSSRIISALIKDNGLECQLYSIEQSEELAMEISARLQYEGLAGQTKVMFSPLVPIELGGKTYNWYDIALDTLPQIDMLIIDGPSGTMNPMKRYPAIPLLFPKLNSNCLVFMDDLNRADEQKVLKNWKAEFNIFDLTKLSAEHGAVSFRIGGH